MDSWKIILLVVLVPPVLIFAALTLTDAAVQRPRFSIRTLLVATTLVAMLLGLMAWAMR
jgi:hypothetical protein